MLVEGVRGTLASPVKIDRMSVIIFMMEAHMSIDNTHGTLMNWIHTSLPTHTDSVNWGYEEIQKEYTLLFRELLRDDYTEKTQEQIDFAARQVGCALQAFVQTFPNDRLDQLAAFVENFISMQIKDLVAGFIGRGGPGDGTSPVHSP